MTYKTHELEQAALQAIKTRKLLFIEDVVACLPCSKPTFYQHKLNELDSIKDAIERNRIETKLKIRKKLFESDNPIALIAAYKLVANDDELDRLTTNRQTPRLPEGNKPMIVTFSLNPNKENDIVRNKLLTTSGSLDDSIDGEIVDDSGE
jgi:hypothetical protein